MEHLLFLTQRIPYPPDKGDKIRSWRILQHLARRYHVHLGCFYDAPEDARHIPFLETVCASVCCVPLRPALARWRSLKGLVRREALTLGYFEDARLQRWVDALVRAHAPSQVFVFCSAVAPYAINHRAARRIIDLVDVDSEKWGQYAQSRPWPLSAVYAREQRKLLAFERRIASAFDGTLLASSAEAELFRRLAPEAAARVHAMPNGIDAAFFDPDRDYPNPFPRLAPAVVFTGAMDYWPNIQAATWFAREAVPLIRRRWPSLEFWIVGANPVAAVRRLGGDGIVVTGRVDDIRPYLAHAAAVVAPLWIARGVLNKVLEAMAMAKPMVATPEACEGIEVAQGEAVLTARTAPEFADRVHAILAGEQKQLGVRARQCVLTQHRWDFAVLDRLMGEACEVAAAG
ncbi:MAG TPA: TIGR03087 family PEP-CTERM/XrtA system glycosyltransferase [Stellaceae bacterium]|nr:TIGR03087 family PEP-CTERM/XrtA system glycosyltransferase [Stellaceae bacterium]